MPDNPEYESNIETGILEAGIWIYREVDEDGDHWDGVRLMGVNGEGLPDKILALGMIQNAISLVNESYEQVRAEIEHLEGGDDG